MILTIAARELRSLFLSPLAWTLLAVVQFILAWIFLVLTEEYLELQSQLVTLEGAPGVTDLVATPLFRIGAWIVLLTTPLLTMRLISEERRNRTLSLLFSAPVAMYEIVLGKYLAILALLLMIVALIALMPLSLLLGTDLDLGKLAAGVLGLALTLASFAAAGLYLSTLTAQPTVAATMTFGLLLLLWIIDSTSTTREEVSGLFTYLAFLTHYDRLLMGLINSVDLIYYLLFVLTCLTLATRRLDNERLQHR
jgi:ABC-2 type transport system permease protein